MKQKMFKKFQIKDIVFLAIMAAVTLCTCAVMPLVASLQTTVFGIAQLITSLQITVFFSIGLMKIRKIGSLFIMAVLMGLFELMMAPAMFFSNVIISVLLELFAILVFKGFKSEKAIFVTVVLFNPLSLPFNVLYNYLFGREAMVAVLTITPWLTVVMTLAIFAVSALGAFLGIKISKELQKSGVMKR